MTSVFAIDKKLLLFWGWKWLAITKKHFQEEQRNTDGSTFMFLFESFKKVATKFLIIRRKLWVYPVRVSSKVVFFPKLEVGC